jgi:hypothetical protein
LRKRKYNLACVEDEFSVRDILSEELDTVSSDELNSESEGECPSDESSNTSTESECESETNVCTDGWEDVMVRNKKPKAYFLKMPGHNSTFYQMMQSLWIISVYFSVTRF